MRGFTTYMLRSQFQVPPSELTGSYPSSEAQGGARHRSGCLAVAP